jgi:hypothetical protein
MTLGHIVAGAIVAGFSAYNGVYYTEEAVANYYGEKVPRNRKLYVEQS